MKISKPLAIICIIFGLIGIYAVFDQLWNDYQCHKAGGSTAYKQYYDCILPTH